MKNRWIKSLTIAMSAMIIFSACGSSQTSESQNTQTDSTQSEITFIEETTQEALTTFAEETSTSKVTEKSAKSQKSKTSAVKLSDIPSYNGNAYVAINNNEPQFKKSEIKSKSFEKYSNLDGKGRCGVAVASVGKDIMPTEKRGAIGSVKPTGWHTVKYDCVDGKYLYNRCHLIGYQLTGENANEKNLITGTRYLNVEGMLPFEDMVADYVKETGNHVMYRVTPIYKGNNLLASGVQLEGYSVEDKGAGISFNIYCYNVQPGVKINYATGDSSLSSNKKAESEIKGNKTDNSNSNSEANNSKNKKSVFILNTNTKKFHKSSCSSIKQMSAANTAKYNGNRQDLIDEGYEPCKRCNP